MVSACSTTGKVPSTMAVELLMDVSDVGCYWLTMRALRRARSTIEPKPRIGLTTKITSPSSERTGVTWTSVLKLRPLGTETSTYSARIVSTWTIDQDCCIDKDEFFILKCI